VSERTEEELTADAMERYFEAARTRLEEEEMS
jgi:hypothetical protein